MRIKSQSKTKTGKLQLSVDEKKGAGQKGKYIEFYNQTRPHSSLKGKTPNQVHLNRLPEKMAA
jgi:hypothetical protein